jgi:hypothetical protein
MIDEVIADDDRRMLRDLLVMWTPVPNDRIRHLISQLSGSDTVLMARRAYPSWPVSPDAATTTLAQ